MTYDYQLVGGALMVILGLVGMTNAMVDKRSPIFGLVGVLVGVGLIGWAWYLSDETLTAQELPQSVFRIIAAWK
jgi:xanthosine utilization system XapX-like protein